MHRPRKPPRRLAPLAALLAALLAAVPSALSMAAPAPKPPLQLSVIPAADYLPRGGELDASALVTLAAPAADLDVRFRVLSPNGAVLLQHTVSRTKVPAGVAVVPLRQPTKSLGLKEGSYRLEVRAEATGHTAALVTQQLLIVDEKRTPVTVAVVVRVRGTPITGPAGVPVSDPATSTLARDAAVAAAELRSVRPDIAFSLALPPVLLDDWRRIAQGYELPGSDVTVSLEETVPTAYRDASRRLADAARGGLEFVGLPFAEPDLGGLEVMDATSDLGLHLSLGSRVTSSTLGTPTVGVMLDGGPIRDDVVGLMSERRVPWALVDATALPDSDGTTPTPGVHGIAGSPLVAVVSDPAASALLAEPATARTELLAHLLKHASSKRDRGQPVVAVVQVGEGGFHSLADLQPALAALERVKWVRLVRLSEAAAARPADALRLGRSRALVPEDMLPYWTALAEVREPAFALRGAAEADDADAIACERAVMLAEGRMISGAARPLGERYAAEAGQLSSSVLGKVSLDAPDVTLSGTSGKVRVSVSNDSGKVLVLTIAAFPHDMRVTAGPRFPVSAPPGETVISIPVQARGSLKGSLELRLMAGERQLAVTHSTVAAGFMDRLAIVGFVVLVLLGLLWYIRSRSQQAMAGLREAAARMPGAGRTKDQG